MRSLVNAKKQGGLTFANFLLGAILLIFGAILGMKVIPAYVENADIQHIIDTIAHDPDLQDGTPTDIRNSWDKRAVINNIDVVSSGDLHIAKTPAGQLVIGVKYSVKIGLVGNVSLLLEFDDTSAHPR